MLSHAKDAIAALILLPLLAACAAPAREPIRSHRGEAAIGEELRLGAHTIKPVAILEDSRCPATLHCIWAGQLRVALTWLLPGGAAHPIEISLGQSASLAGGRLLLETASPDPEEGEPIAPERYRMRFVFIPDMP